MRQRLLRRLNRLENLEQVGNLATFPKAFHDYQVNGILPKNQKHLNLIREIDNFINSALNGHVPSMPDIYQGEI